jgi:hypothetical protein
MHHIDKRRSFYEKTLFVLAALLAMAGMVFASGQAQSGQAGTKQVVVKTMAYGDNSTQRV